MNVMKQHNFNENSCPSNTDLVSLCGCAKSLGRIIDRNDSADDRQVKLVFRDVIPRRVFRYPKFGVWAKSPKKDDGSRSELALGHGRLELELVVEQDGWGGVKQQSGLS